MKKIGQSAAKNAPALGLNALLQAQAQAASASTKVAQVDIYPKPDHNFLNIMRSRFWMNRMNRDFMLDASRLGDRQTVNTLNRAYTNLKHHRKWMGITLKKRNLEVHTPGHQRIFDRKLEVRRDNRAKMAFFCRYVLASKNVKLMGSGL